MILKSVNTLSALERFSADEPVEVNASPIYTINVSGGYNGYYQTEAEAQQAVNEGVGDSVGVLAPGDVFAVIGKNSVYISRSTWFFIDAIADRSVLTFVEWKPVK